MADDAEAGQDQNVNFRMTEEPEEMLEQERIATAFGLEERGAEIAVGQQHGDGTGENRQRQDQQERRDENRPGEQRHPVQGHARRAHVEDRGDEVDGAEDRRGAGEMDRQNEEVHRRTRMAQLRERRIKHPAAAETLHARRAFHEHRDGRQREGGGQQPEGDVVHAREGHVRRADHQRDEPIAETADEGRHDDEEDHRQAMHRDEHVIEVLGVIRRHVRRCTVKEPREQGEHLKSRFLQFGAHRDGECRAEDAGADRKDNIKRADVFMIGRIQVTPPSGRVAMCVMRGRGRAHRLSPGILGIIGCFGAKA